MIDQFFEGQWPPLRWMALTVITTGIAYAAGLLINRVVLRRLAPYASRSSAKWDDALVVELRRRIPFWGLLIGLGLSLGHWPLSAWWLWFVSRALAAAGVMSVTLAVAAIASRLVGDYGRGATPGAPVSGLIRNIVRFVVVTVGLLVALNGFGVEITPMLAALGVGGLAVALALQDPLANLFAGLFVTVAGQIRIGDYVRTDFGVEGTITDFSWDSTRIQPLSGDPVIVPNARIAKAVVTNFSLPTTEIGFAVELVLAHGSDLAKVEQLTLDVARAVERSVPGGVPGFDPLFRVQAFVDLGVRIAVVMRAQTFADQFLLKHELLTQLDARYRQEGIPMARPAGMAPVPMPGDPRR